RHCFNKWSGPRQGQSFGVDVDYTVVGKGKVTSPATAVVLANEFMVVDLRGDDWEIRMWSPSLF
ncbi:MAG: hypothetical protein ABEN55_19645, partial [Bradymonadaceae bacterium]